MSKSKKNKSNKNNSKPINSNRQKQTKRDSGLKNTEKNIRVDALELEKTAESSDSVDIKSVFFTEDSEKSKNPDNSGHKNTLFSLLGLKTKTDYIVCTIGAVIITCLIVLAVLLFCGVFQTKESRAATVNYFGRDESDMSVSLISSTEEEQRVMSDEMDLEFDNGKFDFYSLTEFEFSDASTILPLSLANPSYNKCVLVFTITNGEGEILFRSLGVRPGYILTYISLSRNIPYGENDLKLYVTAFDEKESKSGKSYRKIGNSIADLKLTHTASVDAVEQ